MLEFLIDNIFAMFGGRVFQQTVSIPMGKNGAPLLADLFLYSFNFTFRFIDDVLSLNNSWFGDFADRIYPIELEIKHTTDRSASYLDLLLEIDSEGRLRTQIYD